MKSKRLIPLVSILVIGVGSLLFFNTPPSSPPTLVFKGYERSATNDDVTAKLELRNTTDKVIWLKYYSGSGYPLTPPFLVRPIVPPPKSTNDMGTKITFGFGSFITSGEKLLPGSTVLLEFPLHSGEPAKQVGISYYHGNFSNGFDFVTSFYTPFLDDRANLKDKAAWYWQRFKRKLNAPQHHEIWCADVMSFQAGATNASPIR